MNQAFYAAGVAASQQQYRLNVHANNLANVNTDGFKAKKPGFADLLYRNLTSADGTQIKRGSGSRMVQATTDFTSGSPKETPISQMYAIFGRGFFAVQDPQSGEVYYTRSGNFHMGSLQPAGEVDGEPYYYLCNPEGYYVLDQNREPILINDADMVCPVGVFDFVNTDGMENAGSNLFRPVGKNGPALPGTGTVQYGMLEMSNTDVGGEFGKVIESQRFFSYALKVVQTEDEIESTLNGLRG